MGALEYLMNQNTSDGEKGAHNEAPGSKAAQSRMTRGWHEGGIFNATISISNLGKEGNRQDKKSKPAAFRSFQPSYFVRLFHVIKSKRSENKTPKLFLALLVIERIGKPP
jgi:hypothetical protein